MIFQEFWKDGIDMDVKVPHVPGKDRSGGMMIHDLDAEPFEGAFHRVAIHGRVLGASAMILETLGRHQESRQGRRETCLGHAGVAPTRKVQRCFIGVKVIHDSSLFVTALMVASATRWISRSCKDIQDHLILVLQEESFLLFFFLRTYLVNLTKILLHDDFAFLLVVYKCEVSNVERTVVCSTREEEEDL